MEAFDGRVALVGMDGDQEAGVLILKGGSDLHLMAEIGEFRRPLFGGGEVSILHGGRWGNDQDVHGEKL